MTGPLPGRDNEASGIEIGVGHVSGRAVNLDRDRTFFSGGLVPVRGTETLIELTYQAQIVPWLQLQPVTQFIFNLGAASPTRRTHGADWATKSSPVSAPQSCVGQCREANPGWSCAS